MKTNSDPCNKNLSVARQKMHSSNVYTPIVTGNRLFLPPVGALGGYAWFSRTGAGRGLGYDTMHVEHV